MDEGCQNSACSSHHPAVQHNCTLGHVEFCQCPDRELIPGPEVDQVTVRRFRVRQNDKVVATWFEDGEGNVYKPA